MIMPDMFSFLHFKDGSSSAPTKDKATYAGIVSSLPVLCFMLSKHKINWMLETLLSLFVSFQRSIRRIMVEKEEAAALTVVRAAAHGGSGCLDCCLVFCCSSAFFLDLLLSVCYFNIRKALLFLIFSSHILDSRPQNHPYLYL